MKELKFKTNINCGGCIARLKSDLDGADGVSQWNVDTANPDKILTVQADGITADEVIAIITCKGFQAESAD